TRAGSIAPLNFSLISSGDREAAYRRISWSIRESSPPEVMGDTLGASYALDFQTLAGRFSVAGSAISTSFGGEEFAEQRVCFDLLFEYLLLERLGQLGRRRRLAPDERRTLLAQQGPIPDEIGRASCRERG